jgi:hypothetical protein
VGQTAPTLLVCRALELVALGLIFIFTLFDVVMLSIHRVDSIWFRVHEDNISMIGNPAKDFFIYINVMYLEKSQIDPSGESLICLRL